MRILFFHYVSKKKGGAPKGGEPKNLHFCSLSHPDFRSFSLSGGLLVEFFGGVIKAGAPRMSAFGVLGLSCETPRRGGLRGGLRRRGKGLRRGA